VEISNPTCVPQLQPGSMDYVFIEYLVTTSVMTWQNMVRARRGYEMVITCFNPTNPLLGSWLLLNGTTHFGGDPNPSSG